MERAQTIEIDFNGKGFSLNRLDLAREANVGDAQAEPAGKPDHAMAVPLKRRLCKKAKDAFLVF